MVSTMMMLMLIMMTMTMMMMMTMMMLMLIMMTMMMMVTMMMMMVLTMMMLMLIMMTMMTMMMTVMTLVMMLMTMMMIMIRRILFTNCQFTLAHAFALPHKTNCSCLHLSPSLSSLLLIGDLRGLAHTSKSGTPSLHRHSQVTCSGVRCLWSLSH